ncbi:hypothetical protein VPH35_052622 [Triticum aestivum]|uniref:Uncharacterized protein n=1 Tax=Triticum aestivum TaxID=4565 RepID=A0A077RT45_WHEAT|nr:unnamed protein product [Triticum aestivum]
MTDLALASQITLWSMASTRYESLLHFFWFVCYDLATGMQGEAAAVSRGREDAHHEGVSGMMELQNCNLAKMFLNTVIFLSHNPYADDKVCCMSLWHTDPTGGRKPLGITRASFTRCLQFVEKRMVEDCKGLWSTLLGVGPDISINVYVYESLRSHWKMES